MQKPVEKKLLTTEEVARMLDVSPVTVYRYKAEKGLPFIKIGGIVRFDNEDVWEWINKHKNNNHKGR